MVFPSYRMNVQRGRTMCVDDRPTVAAPDDDPHLWLEEVEGERAADFVEQQNRRTLETFGGAQFAADRDLLAAIYDRPDNIPYVTRHGGFLYNLWKDPKNPRGLWRRKTIAEFRKAQPQWEVVLDVDKLAAEENQDWLLNWTQPLAGKPPRSIVGLSRGGSDAVTLREFDLDTKTFVTGGFVLPEAKSGGDWLDADTLLLSSALGEGMATTSGYARSVRRWRRGEAIDTAPVIFEVPADRMGAYVDIDDTGSAPRVWFIDRIDFFNRILARRRSRHEIQTRSADRRLDGSLSRLDRRQVTNRVDGRRPRLRAGRHARYLAFRLFGRRSHFRSSSNPGHGGRCRASSGPPANSCCRSSTNCGRCSRSAPRPRTDGAATPCRGFRRSASSMSGVSIATWPRAMATCSPISRTR